VVSVLTVITPTRDRPEAFALLERWVARQTLQPDQWIVVNDGPVPYEYHACQDAVQRATKPGELHSLCSNLLTAIPLVKGDRIAILEDDDWLGPDYLNRLDGALIEAELAGSAPALYYNVAHRRFHVNRNAGHCSLGQTGLRVSLLPTLRRICRRGNPYIDLRLWHSHGGSRLVIPSAGLHVSMKGMPGTKGIGKGHARRYGRPDPDGAVLLSWIGQDAQEYEPFHVHPHVSPAEVPSP
jgi:hypothetical protein